MARITILMPVYNGERFLKETVDNVLCQTYTDFSFLIINDGSTDRTEEIILSYDDLRIIYCRNEKNLGLVMTLNKGIEMIETEFLARMDADDLWEPTKLAKQITLLDEKPDVGICGTFIRKFGAINGDFIFPIDNEHLKVGFMFYCTMSHPSVVYRTSFLKESELRYSADFYPAEDYKMWIDALQLTQIYNIPEILVYYRQHEEQITQDSNSLQRKKTDLVRQEILERIAPDFTAEEKEFHVYKFTKGKVNSIKDYKEFVNWSKVLHAKNKQNGQYINPDILEKELSYHIQIFLKGYILEKYFKKMDLKNWSRYFFSFEWIYLSLRRNIAVFYKCLKG